MLESAISALISTGLVLTLIGIIYKRVNSDIKELKEDKVNREACELKHETTDEKLDKLEKISSSTHDAVILIKGALNIAE